jgi:hypothetical protein
MKPIGLFAAVVLAPFALTTFSSGQSTQSARSAAQGQPKSQAAVPVTMTECEGTNNCATWTFLGAQGNGRWPSGEIANLTVERYGESTLVIRRGDSTGPSAGLTAVYTGTRHDDRVGGEFTSSWPGHWDNKTGNWYATVEKAPETASGLQHIALAGMVHLQALGDSPLRDATWAGTKGQSRRLEGFTLNFASPIQGLGIEYMCHVQGLGDQLWMPGGSFCGTRGQSRSLEGMAIRLTGANATSYDIVYACHLAVAGDVGPVKNGAFCGTRGQSRQLEAMEVWVTPGHGEPGQPLQPLPPIQRPLIAPVVCVPWFFSIICAR